MNIDKFSQKQSKLTDITSELANEIKLVLKAYNESKDRCYKIHRKT